MVGRTFVSQPEQIFATEEFNDILPAGKNLETGSLNLQTDLNAIRSQLRRILWTASSGSWYDDVTGSLTPRGVNVINTDLYDLEQKRLIYRVQKLVNVYVPTGSNWVALSVSGTTAPANAGAIGDTTQTGTIAALMSGTFDQWAPAFITGSSTISPKNLVIIRDADTGAVIQTSGTYYDVYALMQAESSSIDGADWDDSTNRAQLSFVVENPSGTLSACPASDIGGRVIWYSYPTRVALDNIPEDAYMSNHVFLDIPAESAVISGNALLSDITLDRAIDNQVGTVTQDNSIAIRIAAGQTWTWLSGSTELWKLTSSDSGNELAINVDWYGVSGSNAASFESGISVATGSTNPINVGVTDGQIDATQDLTVIVGDGYDLNLSGGNNLSFGDAGAEGSYFAGPINFSSGTTEWNTFYDLFGADATILNAFTALSQSLSQSLTGSGRVRYNAGTTTTPYISPDTNVTFGSNLDAQLGSYAGRDFAQEVEVYLNGVLCLPGTDASNPNDVYPGDDPSTGDLKFPMKLRSGSIITLEVYGD